MPRLRSVRVPDGFEYRSVAHSVIAKFTGYQYGGRPLGLTFVKYTNVGGGGGGDAMEGTEATGGLTQDQIM
jgi:hypothetical protein